MTFTRSLTTRLPALCAAAVLLLGADARADDLFGTIPSAPLSEVWLNPGFYSYHYQRNKDLNDSNPGFGVEYRYSTTSSLTAGRFYNSDRAYSNYVGWYYEPWTVGPFRVGAVVGAFNGYPKFLNGGWFPALIPVVSYEYHAVGLNLGIVPTFKDRLYGAFSFQFKVRI